MMKTRRNLLQIWLLCVLMLQALTSEAQPVTQICAGYAHSVFLKSDGSLWTMGGSSRLWTNSAIASTNRPQQVMISGVTAIAAGAGYNLLLKNDGSLWAAGADNSGQLGDSHYLTYTNQPELIVTGVVTAIATKYRHSLFIKSDGSLWGMGFNGFGELGCGFNGSTNQPVEIVASNVTAIAVGQDFSLFLKCDGSLWAMGNNSQGELGSGIAGQGNQYIYGYSWTNVPQEIVASNVTAIAAGVDFSLFLKSDGSLWAMGDNAAGELGTGGSYYSTNSPQLVMSGGVKAIAAGAEGSLLLKSDGSLWGMGGGEYGGGVTNRPELIVASDVTAIAGGLDHILYLKSDGSLWGLGDNDYGQLGDGTFNYTNQPEQIVGPYNQISGQLLGSTNIQLSFVGIANTNYALDCATSLSPPNWIPLVTNPAGSFGALVFTNAPDATTNNFWRIRSVP
jgi:alpha-tubulin suppressor-like RCC1 family protein